MRTVFPEEAAHFASELVTTLGVEPAAHSLATLGWEVEKNGLGLLMAGPRSFAEGPRVYVAVIATLSYVIAFLPLLFLGAEGWWLIKILAMASAPLIVVASIVAVVFANSVLRHPFRWASAGALAAITISSFALWQFTGTSIGLLSLPVALPAALLFYAFARVRQKASNS